MRGTNDIAAQLMLENIGIQPLQPGRRGGTNIRLGLVTIQTD